MRPGFQLSDRVGSEAVSFYGASERQQELGLLLKLIENSGKSKPWGRALASQDLGPMFSGARGLGREPEVPGTELALENNPLV